MSLQWSLAGDQVFKVEIMKRFKYIRSNQKDIKGKTIYSGQKVNVNGRINPRQLQEVYFEPNFGFRVQGNNFADAYDIQIVSDINILQKIYGALRFAFFNLTGI